MKFLGSKFDKISSNQCITLNLDRVQLLKKRTRQHGKRPIRRGCALPSCPFKQLIYPTLKSSK